MRDAILRIQSTTARSGLVFAAAVALNFAGCEKQVSEAVVISKKVIPESEKVVDGERSTVPPSWWVTVRLPGGRTTEILVHQDRWDTTQVGDAVQVSYSKGNYTGILWRSKLK
ncbi:MAG: hypothetical protein QOE70_4954 [Chthoniobacter sp.]|jgi:hypothetical protein|nr:hypothetical protein [Chthoniobacter sp.]